jgi:hypothetical protein
MNKNKENCHLGRTTSFPGEALLWRDEFHCSDVSVLMALNDVTTTGTIAVKLT